MPNPLSPSPSTDRVERVRAFNRFYTRRIGVLHEGLLHTSFTLTESRLLWELAHCETTTATELAGALDLDAGYLSRLLGSFKERGLVKSTRSKDDARHLHLSLTAADECLVGDDRAAQHVRQRVALHGLPDPVAHEPCGFVGHAEGPV